MCQNYQHLHQLKKIKRYGVIILTLIFLTVNSSVVWATNDPPPYIYVGQQNLYGQDNNIFSPRKWWVNAKDGQNDKMRYYIASNHPDKSKVDSAFSQWNGILPSWAQFQSTTNQNLADIIVDDTPCPVTATACFMPTAFHYDSWSRHTNWTTANLRLNFTTSHSNNVRQQTAAHEIGHGIGLHERYLYNPSSTTNFCYNNEDPTVMDGVYLDGNNMIQPCDNTTTPTVLDTSRVTEFYRKGILLKSDSSASECDPFSSQPDIWTTTNGFGQVSYWGRFVDCAWHSVGRRSNFEYWNGTTWVASTSYGIDTYNLGSHTKVDTTEATRYFERATSKPPTINSAYWRWCSIPVVRTPFNSTTITYSTSGYKCTDYLYAP